MALFSKAVVELMKLLDGKKTEDVEADFNWFMGNMGVVRDLRSGNIVSVPAELVGGLSSIPDDLKHMERRKFLSLFTTVLSDDEAMERFPVAKENVPRMRAWCTDNGVPRTASIVRFIDPDQHLLYNMKIAAQLCGPCSRISPFFSCWDEYSGLIAEVTGPTLIFGAPFLACLGLEGYHHNRYKKAFVELAQKLGVSFQFIRGSAALVSLLALSHFNETGGRLDREFPFLPERILWAQTDTHYEGGGPYLGWKYGDQGFHCNGSFYGDINNNNSIGCLALGVVPVTAE